MAYDSGAASNTYDLLDVLRAFLVAEGWTVNRWAVVDTYQTLNVSFDLGSGTKYFNFYARTDEIYYSMSTGYAAVSWGSQPGESGSGIWDLQTAGAYVGYEIYYSDNVIFMPVEISSGAFMHLVFGEITKYGTYNGGEFVDASKWTTLASPQVDEPQSNFNHAPFHGNSAQVAGIGQFACDALGDYFMYLDKTNSTNNTAATTGVFSFFDGAMLRNQPNASTGRSVMSHIHFFVRDYAANKSHPAGYIPNVRLINMRDMSPKQNIDTDWYVYPMVKKGDPADSGLGDYNSGYFAYAVKRVV